MKSKRNMRKLCLSIGDFIRYWGFRRIQGAIWARLYLSSCGLTVTELAKDLGFSKPLVSSAIPVLIEYGLIYQLPQTDEKSKQYVANNDFENAIKDVIKKREAKMISNVRANFDAFKDSDTDLEISEDRIDQLENAITTAEVLMRLCITSDEFLEPAMFQY